MTPQEIGKDIFNKWYGSAFVTKEIARRWLESAKKDAAEEIEYGFFKAEQEVCLKDPQAALKIKEHQ